MARYGVANERPKCNPEVGVITAMPTFPVEMPRPTPSTPVPKIRFPIVRRLLPVDDGTSMPAPRTMLKLPAVRLSPAKPPKNELL